MENPHINPDILKELYSFISRYYNDPTLADYILNIFSINKDNIAGSNVPYEKFYRILHYIQKMSGDQLFCFNAGRDYSSTRLLGKINISGTFSPARTIKKIDKILIDIFPVFEISAKAKSISSLNLLIRSNDISAKPNFFFAEYLKGIISQIPKNWNLPLAAVNAESYSFGMDEILKESDIPYKKIDSVYFIYDNEVAKEGTYSDNGASELIVLVTDDLFIKDIFIKKNTRLNSKYLSLKIKWHNYKFLKRFIFSLFALAGTAAYIYSIIYYNNYLQQTTGIFIIFEMLLILIYNYTKYKFLKKIFNETESNLLDELSLQRSTTSEAIQDTLKRLQSIENVIEITKEIIYDKNILNLFENIRKLSAKALNADRTTVFLHDKDKKELRSGPELSDEKQEFRIPEDKGIVGEVFKLKKIVNVKDAYNNPNFNKAIDRQTGYETKTILSAPLLDLEKNFLGVIQVLNKKDGEFEKIDEHIIETLSTYIATALKDTFTISSLQKRGIDPDMLNGLSSITQHIYQEYGSIQNMLKGIDNPAVTEQKSRIENMSALLEKLAFLFNEQYYPNPTDISVSEALGRISSIINNNKEDINITYDEKSSLASNLKLKYDTDLFNKALYEILTNSIESLPGGGTISLHAYYYVIISNDTIHDLSLEKIIAGFNTYSEENSFGFIKFVTSRKPFLESDLLKIKDTMKEYIALEFFDTGQAIPSAIKEKIYHPFFSTKNRFGLGLAIAKKALTLMNGSIEGPLPKENGKSMRVLIPL